ncbi:SIMPL superfamily protein [Oleiphilus messinensis]|uniref:SIMPL superfamily protein n=1 Tax=Oleiphilus messinensis TaxID=141451 RepID=A0A1Y0IBU1_9GAMM|nr:SIMPL domain-containing protein [Oleiphilus messinensis]ARU57236.1 SIMPL superfamily protein [Oleiphilus messinensis]
MSRDQNKSIPSTEHIVVNGSSTVDIEPDLAEINVSIKKIDDVMAEAKSNVDQRSSNLINYLKEIGVDSKDLNSSELRIVPNREYRNGEYIEKGHEVDRDITIKLRDLSKYNEVMEKLVNVPIDRVQKIKMEISEKDEASDYAIREAVENAKRKAKLVSELMNVKLGPIYSISNAWGGEQISIGGAASRANYSDASFEPGTIEINGSVELVYYIDK